MARKNMKKRKWKGSLRKTIGALLMATAIVIAAIPVENLGAAETTREMKVTVDPENCKIPLVDKREKIYTTGDGSFQFAYVAGKDAASTNR